MTDKDPKEVMLEVDEISRLVKSKYPEFKGEVGYAWDKRSSSYVIGILFDELPPNVCKGEISVDQICDPQKYKHKIEIAIFD